ncbi:MAG: VanZ family protein [Eubacteriales bacterium]|nr:VanZ family protein [Eubacteriales bacterium]
MRRTNKRMALCITLLTLNLAFIWGNSLMPGTVSEAISSWVKSLLALVLPMGGPGGSGGFWVRKLAHLTEFTALGLCLGWLFAMLNKGKWTPLLWGVAAACVDETIQCFVPGRGPGVRDVCIDAAGVLTGVLVLRLACVLTEKFGGKQP